jgi:GNAT superfamily N-acetyltransferase
MNEISLRMATQADAAFAYAVEEDAMRRYAEQTWGKWNPATDPAAHIVSFEASAHQIIDVGGRAVGILSVERHPDHLFVAKLYILGVYRGTGIGSEVLASILSEAKTKRNTCGFRRSPLILVRKHFTNGTGSRLSHEPRSG